MTAKLVVIQCVVVIHIYTYILRSTMIVVTLDTCTAKLNYYVVPSPAAEIRVQRLCIVITYHKNLFTD